VRVAADINLHRHHAADGRNVTRLADQSFACIFYDSAARRYSRHPIDEQHARGLRDKGIVETVAKPFDVEEMLQVIERLVQPGVYDTARPN
jgi:hypothetical protein